MYSDVYINQEYKNYIRSKYIASSSVFDGATTQSIVIDYRDQGARAILLHRVIIEVQPKVGAGANVTLIDDFGNELIRVFDDGTSMDGVYQLDWIIPASRIKLVMNPCGVVRFTAHYQFLYPASTKPVKDFAQNVTTY